MTHDGEVHARTYPPPPPASARRVLERLSRNDLSNTAFPFGQVRRLQVAGAPVLALRVTYVGELGWEMHVPVEFASTVYGALMQAGEFLSSFGTVITDARP